MTPILYTIAVIVLLVAALLWAIRSGQFKQQERARRLPLNGDAAEEAGSPSESGPKRGERRFLTPLLAAILTTVVLLWLTFLWVSR